MRLRQFGSLSSLVKSTLFVLAASTPACRTLAPTAEVKVTNGIPTNRIDAVVCLNIGFGCCTGTFINKTTMLTAAHCLGHVGPDDYKVSVNGTAPTAKHYYQNAFPMPWLSKGRDLAILEFPASVSQSLGITTFLNISQSELNPGDDVILVGFGKTDHADAVAPGPKNYGTNTVSSTSPWRVIVLGLIRPAGVPGVNVALDSGDSGGPLLNAAGEIVGVASTSGPVGGEMETTYVRVPNAGARVLLADFLPGSVTDQNPPDDASDSRLTVTMTVGTYVQNENSSLICKLSKASNGISMNCGGGEAPYTNCQNGICYFNGDITSQYRIRIETDTTLTVITPDNSFGFTLQR